MTFKLGLSYLPLANAGLDALELWSSELSPKLLHPYFKHILPYLDDYLRTLSYAAGIADVHIIMIYITMWTLGSYRLYCTWYNFSKLA